MQEYAINNEETFSSLTKEQKEAIGLLSIGTFLEYFDLMLYIHMAVLLNELFFPKADPHTAALYSATAFCSTFVFRPIGALLFGWIGDNIGRRSTVIITTFMMAFSCFVMANLPTYAQIGITATYAITICRIVQGMSSMAELIGAQLYLTEITKPPVRYSVVAFIAIAYALGGTIALLIATLTTLYELNWRAAFWFGAGVAIIGFVARYTLKETPDFANAKKRVHNSLNHSQKKNLATNPIWQDGIKQDKKIILALFLMDCAWPVCFYFAYIYCGNILKQDFGFSAEQVIHHNFLVSIIPLLGAVVLTILSYRIYPLKIVKIKLCFFIIITLLTPLLFTHVKSIYTVFSVQCCIILFACDYIPAIPIIYKHISIFRRFTYAACSYAISRTFMYIITSFGLIYLIEYFGYLGFLIIMIPTILGYWFGICHFDKLEQEADNHS